MFLLSSYLHSKLTESAYLLKKNNEKKEALIYLRKVPIYLRIPDHPPPPHHTSTPVDLNYPKDLK